MGFLRALIKGDPLVPEIAPSTPTFSVDIDPGVLYGVQTVDDAINLHYGGPRLTRAEAIQIPAVKRARDLIASGIGQWPLVMTDSDQQESAFELLSAPEAGTTAQSTWTSVVDDLLFHGVAWLHITHVGWHGLPAQVVRLDPATVTVQPDLKVYRATTGNGTARIHTPDSQLIRIDGPNDSLLIAGARALRALSRLEAAALNAAEGVPPQDYFTPTDGIDTQDADAIQDLLDSWETARKTRSTAYVPGSLEYKTNGWNPEQLQLVQAREMAITEVARLTGIDAEDLSVTAGTSRTYFNAQDRRRERLDFVLGPFRKAIENRLSMPDVCPRGYSVRFDTTEFSRADGLTQAQQDEIDVRSGVLTRDEVRARRGLAPLGDAAPALPASKEATRP